MKIDVENIKNQKISFGYNHVTEDVQMYNVTIEPYDMPVVFYIKRDDSPSVNDGITLNITRDRNEVINERFNGYVNKLAMIFEAEDEYHAFFMEKDKYNLQYGSLDDMMLMFFKNTAADYARVLNGKKYDTPFMNMGKQYRTVEGQLETYYDRKTTYSFNIRSDVIEGFSKLFNVIESMEENTAIEMDKTIVYKNYNSEIEEAEL